MELTERFQQKNVTHDANFITNTELKFNLNRIYCSRDMVIYIRLGDMHDLYLVIEVLDIFKMWPSRTRLLSNKTDLYICMAVEENKNLVSVNNIPDKVSKCEQ